MAAIEFGVSHNKVIWRLLHLASPIMYAINFGDSPCGKVVGQTYICALVGSLQVNSK